MDEGEVEASYEIQAEGDVVYDDTATAEAEAAVTAQVDNGADTDKSKHNVKKPESGDAEADEHDMVAMPSIKVVTNDLSTVKSYKCFFIHSLSTEDLENPTVTDLLRNPSCADVKIQFSRGSTDASHLIGAMTVGFSSSKQATIAISALQEMRPELTVETLKSSDTANDIVEKWRKEHSISEKPETGAMVIVKNLDSASVTIEKLAEIFPDAEDITISSQPQASYLGKLKG